MKKVLFLSFIMGCICAPGQAAIIYFDNFDGPAGVDLNGTTPDITTGGVVWQAGSYVNADGTYGQGTAGQMFTAVLPFSPRNNKIYELSASVDNTGDWVAIGFQENVGNLETRILDNAPLLWSLARGSQDTQFDQAFRGPGTNGGLGNTTTVSATDLRVRIQTKSETEWEVTWFFDGSPQFQQTYDPVAVGININYAAFGSNGMFSAVTGTISSFQLSMIPLTAWNPDPADAAEEVSPDVTLKWNKGRDPNDNPNEDITQHYLYYIVYDAAAAPAEPNLLDPATIGPITVADIPDPISYPAAGTLPIGTDKVVGWRVDESVNGSAPTDPATIVGDVWQFKTEITTPVLTRDPSNTSRHPYDQPRYEGPAPFTCEFTSKTPPTADWYRQGDPDPALLGTVDLDNPAFSDGDIGIALTALGGDQYATVLTIANVEQADEGVYYCQVNNASNQPETSETASLLVKKLLARYEFEGNTQDSIGVNHGTLKHRDPNFPDPLNYIAGIVGAQATELDGNQYLELSTEAFPKAGFSAGLESGTLSCWLRLDGILAGQPNAMILGVNNVGGGNACQFWIEPDSQVNIRVRDLNGTAAHKTATPAESLIADPDWHLLTGTYQVAGSMQLYIDGAAVGAPVAVAEGMEFQDWLYPILIGANNHIGQANGFLEGALDDLRIYNYALSAEEVADLYLMAYPDARFCISAYASEFDFNGDCVVDMLDFAQFSAAWLDSGLYPE
ncbi:MAG: immunoglobulin domain-containing protein [Sedimentisphaerales bacterium]|nr:immunoglobulin domain-containing protein [Sedimentisphaerales bacterium]